VPDPPPRPTEPEPISVCDIARFRSDDRDDLVAASFACPVCLHVDATVDVTHDNGCGTTAVCRCARCETSWRLVVAGGQLLRLAGRTRLRRGSWWQLDIRFGGDWL
jgi:hypothetical protein